MAWALFVILSVTGFEDQQYVPYQEHKTRLECETEKMLFLTKYVLQDHENLTCLRIG